MKEEYTLSVKDKNPKFKARILRPDGYQLGCVETAQPFSGTCAVHLMAFDFASDNSLYPLSETVVRQYGRCLIMCETDEQVAEYTEFFRDAVRVTVLSYATASAYLQEDMHRHNTPGSDRYMRWACPPDEAAMILAHNAGCASEDRIHLQNHCIPTLD